MGRMAVVAGVKGGVGKSLLAGNLAVLAAERVGTIGGGGRTVLVDLDPQETTMSFAGARAATVEGDPDKGVPGRSGLADVSVVSLASLDEKALRAELRRLVKTYEWVIVDVGARDSRTQRTALALADVAVTPFPPRGPELWTAEKVAAMIDDVKAINEGLVVHALVNRADPESRGQDNAEAAGLLAAFADAWSLAPFRLHETKAISAAYLSGLAVHEARPLPRRAAEEMAQLAALVLDGPLAEQTGSVED